MPDSLDIYIPDVSLYNPRHKRASSSTFEVTPMATIAILGLLSVFLSLFINRFFSSKQKRRSDNLNHPPVVPGLPLLGNLLQLKEKKPHKTFAKLAETYGPVYIIRTGASSVFVLNSTAAAKEAMVTRFSSITTRKLSKALSMLSFNKTMVATSDYNDFHKMAKKHILTNVLGANAQKRHRSHRDTMIENIVNRVHDHVKNYPLDALNFRDVFEAELFGVALKQAIGRNVESVYVEELGATLTRKEIFRILVLDGMEAAIEVDWRDFFPYLRWIPNKRMEGKVQQACFRKTVVMKALIAEEKKRIASGEQKDCFLDYLLTEGKALSDEQLTMLVWEEIVEASDTTLVTTEWAMFELAKDPIPQDRLLHELKRVCGNNKMTEENLAQLPFLSGVFHESLRKYSPVPVLPTRYAHEDTQIAGFFIPAGSEIAINLYGCNMDKKQWDNPEKWSPERFLDEKYNTLDLYKTLSFGGGKRVCAGSLMAMLVACSTIGRLVQEFEWSLNKGEEEDVNIVGLTSRKLKPLHVMVKPRTH